MELEDKLWQICDHTEKTSRSALEKQTCTLAKLIERVLKDATWGHITARTRKNISVAVAHARKLARILDATGYLTDKVFQPDQARIVDLKLKHNYYDDIDQIREIFEMKEVPQRGFIYVAWSAKPEEYWYVGKANGSNRLKFPSHGKLANATAKATKLSLIFPSRSDEGVLSGVEASVLALIEFYTGKLPKLNENRGTIVRNSGTEELRTLSDFLISIAEELHCE